MKKNKFFVSFSVEKVTQIQHRWKRRQKKESLEDVDQEIEEFFDLYSMCEHAKGEQTPMLNFSI